MGGELGFETKLAHGSCFWVEFPKVNKDLNLNSTHSIFPLSDNAEPASEISAVNLRTVVYIEDNADNAKLMYKIISRMGNLQLYHVAEAKRGLEMIAAIKPAVILLDIDLPDMNGYDALITMHELYPFTRQIPAIAVSANAMQKDIEDCMAIGFFDYITKPINIPLFMQTMNNALKKVNELNNGI